MHAQGGAAAAIVAKGGDYTLQLKRNQGTLHEDVAEYLDNPPASAELLSHQEVDKGHGRVEDANRDGLARRRLAAGAPRLAGPRGHRQGGRGAAPGRRPERPRPLLSAQRQALRPHRALPLGHREQPALGAGRVDGRGPGAHRKGARMHPDKRSVRRQFILAQRSDDFLLEMIRCVRGRE